MCNYEIQTISNVPLKIINGSIIKSMKIKLKNAFNEFIQSI
jgi:hypothetical protein